MTFFTPDDEGIARLTLGHMIRSAREMRGLYQSDLARLSFCSQPDVSNIENGVKSVDFKQFNLILRALEIEGEDRVEFDDQFKLINTSPLAYRHIQSHGVARKQREIANYERRASAIRVFEPTLVPGLLQTRPYVRELFSAIGVPERLIADGVASRVERQEILNSGNRNIHLLMAEAALYSAPGTTSVQLGQLRALRVHLTADSPRVGILPTTVGFPPRTGTAFEIVNDAFVSAETVVTEQQITETEEVKAFVELHELLARKAWYGEKALGLVDEAFGHFAASAEPQ